MGVSPQEFNMVPEVNVFYSIRNFDMISLRGGALYCLFQELRKLEC